MSPAAPVESIVWSQPHDMPAIEVLDVANCQRLWTVFHRTYTICTVTEHGGLTDWRYRGRHHTLYRRQLSLMEPGEIHRNIKHTARGSFHVVQIDPGFVEHLAREAGIPGTPHFAQVQVDRPALFAAFVRFHQALLEGATLLERQSRLTDCVVRALSECGERRPRPEPAHDASALSAARDYLHEHIADHVGLVELAKIAGMSRFHFLRRFAERFGLPPHAYQIKLRVERTRALLKAGVPVPEIEAGFADQSHLIRQFKRIMGVTPGRYQAMVATRRVFAPFGRQQ